LLSRFAVQALKNLESEVTGMAINVVERVDETVPIRHVLVSVSDKRGLEEFIPELVRLNPDMRILSTGGTFGHLERILAGKASRTLSQVSEYTGQPETQGGLVKTLDFKIYLGLLTETYNEAHQADLQRTHSVPIDMVVVNLYPFRETIAKAGVTVEQARGHIDIGGPCMIRAAAKNFIRVASVVDPDDYPAILSEIRANSGRMPLALRYRLAQKAFAHTAAYDRAIADYLSGIAAAEVSASYRQ
jgi:phosphoribosylaminoimidazolecarboxamide formyltransferase/IMP cyclohydrolase